MANVEKISVALTGEQIAMIKAAVETGEYATTSEVIRDALRDWQARRHLSEDAIRRIRELWDEGIASGPARELDLDEVKAKARRRLASLTGKADPHKA